MVWCNGPLTVYHGTDDMASVSIVRWGVTLVAGRSNPDFGPGFYTTTYLHQARQWANQRVRGGHGTRATVVSFALDRPQLARLAHLAFVADTADFYDLVAFSRAGAAPLHGVSNPYDAIYGPVSLWPQLLVIKDCDQISFHTPLAIGVLSSITISTIITVLKFFLTTGPQLGCYRSVMADAPLEKHILSFHNEPYQVAASLLHLEGGASLEERQRYQDLASRFAWGRHRLTNIQATSSAYG